MNLEDLLTKKVSDGVIHGGSEVNEAMVAVSNDTRILCANRHD